MQVKLTTSRGDITLKLNADAAPVTVENFLGYVKSGHYDGTIFHRVIKEFMVQGGGMDADMRNKPAGAGIKNEADNGLSNLTGTVSMARTSDPHSASAQFFINVKDNLFLNHRSPTPEGWGYCVFGEVSDGMDVVTDIEMVPTTRRGDHAGVPEEPITIIKAEVVGD
ncbi:MAG: peptidylprolyl isomerase [Gammaproteobacteria bacterium]